MRKPLIVAAVLLIVGCQSPPRISVAPDYNRGWRADPATEAAIARRDASMNGAPAADGAFHGPTEADYARCDYEATAGAAGTPGILMQLAVHGQLEELCLRSAAYAH